MKLSRKAAIAVLKNLRCESCRRAPLHSEVLEMYESFGAKLEATGVGEGNKLVWECKACGPS